VTSSDTALRMRPHSRAGNRLHGRFTPFAFLIPWLVGLAVITLGPMLASLWISFTDYDLIGEASFVGIENYVRMFTADPRYLNSVVVTATYVLVSVPLQLAAALGLAVLLNRGIAAADFYRAVFYLPSLLGGSVALSLLWRQVFGREGLFNRALELVGLQSERSWIGDPDTAIWTLILLNVWTFGSPMVIFLAGLRQIPSEVNEAAEMDGAGPIRRFLRITMPLLSPVLLFNIVLQTINAFQAFVQAYIVSGGTGGPADSTMFYTLYLYQQGFTSFDMGYASAMAWVLLAAIAVVTAVQFLLSKYWVHYEDE
jgi:multiple sugar transport system permease protein